MERAVERGVQRGLSLLDVLVVLALLALFVWLLRLDWAGHRRLREVPAPTAVAGS
jgi:hypothetical protein